MAGVVGVQELQELQNGETALSQFPVLGATPHDNHPSNLPLFHPSTPSHLHEASEKR
jgi:hypothetical protein